MRTVICLLAIPLVFASAARAGDKVDLALVLVTDVSRSIDDSEFELEKKGYASAFTSKQVVDAIRGGAIGAIGVAYVEFASSFEVRTVLDWNVIHDEASAQIFGEAKALLEQRGQGLADADLFVGAIAIANRAIVVTGNRRHYERIPGVTLEDWIRS